MTNRQQDRTAPQNGYGIGAAQMPAPPGAPDADNETRESLVLEHALLAELANMQERVAELDLRLRERLEESVVLDSEVRSLQEDVRIKDSYIGHLERLVDELTKANEYLHSTQETLVGSFEDRQQLAEELARHAERASFVLVDRMVAMVEARNLLHGTIRMAVRRIAATPNP